LTATSRPPPPSPSPGGRPSPTTSASRPPKPGAKMRSEFRAPASCCAFPFFGRGGGGWGWKRAPVSPRSAPVYVDPMRVFVSRVHKEITLLWNAKVPRRLLGLELNRSRANPVRRAASKSALLRGQVSALSDAVLASSSGLGHLIMK
jgi:hypothetical protein